MRYYSKRRPQNIIIPIYPAAIFAGDSVQKLGNIKYVYYTQNSKFVQATGVYAESSGGTITAQAGQSILTIDPTASSSYIFMDLSNNSSIAQTVETVQGKYYFVVPGNTAYIALEDGTIMLTLMDLNAGEAIGSAGQAGVTTALYGLNLELE